MGPEHRPPNGPQTHSTALVLNDSTLALNTSPNIGPDYVSHHGLRRRPTTQVPDMFHNMGLGHVPHHKACTHLTIREPEHVGSHVAGQWPKTWARHTVLNMNPRYAPEHGR